MKLAPGVRSMIPLLRIARLHAAIARRVLVTIRIFRPNAIHAAMKPGRLLHLRLGDGVGLTAVWHGTWEPIARDAKVQFDSELLVDHETGWQDGLQRNTCQDDCLHSGTLRCCAEGRMQVSIAFITESVKQKIQNVHVGGMLWDGACTQLTCNIQEATLRVKMRPGRDAFDPGGASMLDGSNVFAALLAQRLNMDIMDAKASVLNGPHGHDTVDPNQPGEYKFCQPT